MAGEVSDDELFATSRQTLAHYASVAGTFWDGTKDHDVTQNYQAFLGAIEGEPPFTVLDFGCGPGRDLRYFRSLGHRAIGLEGCAEFARMARAYSGCEILEQNFLSLELANGTIHGVFANASLFHVPSRMLPRVLGELRDALRPRGVLFSSNPHGHDEEGWQRDRYGCYYSLETWRRFVTDAGFIELTHYYRPAGRPLAEQRWLATLYRKA